MGNLTNQQSYLKVYGGTALKGEVQISGAKNSILPLLFASLLSDGEHKFKNTPHLKDVQLALKMLSSVGVHCKSLENQIIVKTLDSPQSEPCPESTRAFRASILSLAPLLSRTGRAKIPFPGGCDIGLRPINIHLEGLKKFGAKIEINKNWIQAVAPKEGLKATDISLPFPSVGATENLIMASVLAQGTSRLFNIACEPEVEDLICYLRHLGAKIKRESLRELKIVGVNKLEASSKAYTVIPDRIEAGTWLIAGACTQGEISVQNCRPEHLHSLLEKLKSSGFFLEIGHSNIRLKSESSHKAVKIKTGIYPFFPTDLQSQFMTLMIQLEGTSFIEETIFENRFRYVPQLNLLGAGIEIRDQSQAFVKGPVRLKGNRMEASDLRAGAGLVLAALTAEGESQIYGLHHIQRGYDNFFSKLKSLNANAVLYDS